MSLALLLAAAAATAVGAAALHAAHGLRRQLTALRSELTASGSTGSAAVPAAPAVPAARAVPAEEIRAAVADALAEERERELAEARAFWAAQDARDAGASSSLLGPLTGFGDEAPLYLPRQADFAGPEPLLGADALDALDALEAAIEEPALAAEDVPETAESPELAAARRRHPSHPANSQDPGAAQGPAVADQERTVARLDDLAESATPLTDVRPGPLGTLDVYVFADGTTICMTPGDRETAEQLADALRAGNAPVLLGGSGIAGAYSLTFAYGEKSIYVLADRVVASL
ncbi:hypothetical protein [Streptomyces sp. 8N706]|uniref:hypothetical protein n=1 Tax=Streptomyces sp. 8N706 TaxID=3457416 RepID=UPI003FD15E6F